MLFASVAVAPPAAAAGDDARSPARGAFSYTIEPISPLTQSWPVINGEAPYFNFLLTNTSAQPDSFRLRILNLQAPANWFPQVCLRSICFPDSAKLLFAAGASDTVGVNIVPFSDGIGDADFVVTSVGDPLLESTFHVRLFAGAAAVGAGTVPAAQVLRLAQSFPNPAVGEAHIAFALPRAERATLRVFDVSGRLVATLLDATLAAGPHAVQWHGELGNGRQAPSGSYFYRLDTPSGALTRSLVLIR
jgi:hypothetical protein